MNIEKYKAKLESAIYENSGCSYIGEDAIREVLEEYYLERFAVSGSLLVEIKSLLVQYRDEEMPDWNTPFHHLYIEPTKI